MHVYMIECVTVWRAMGSSEVYRLLGFAVIHLISDYNDRKTLYLYMCARPTAFYAREYIHRLRGENYSGYRQISLVTSCITLRC